MIGRRKAGSERVPRSFWFDPRFGIGVALVIASVVGVVMLVTAADRTSEVWAAREPLAAGDSIDRDDLILRDVRLGEASALYLGRGALPSDGLVVTQTVAAGELVPASAVGGVQGLSVASVVVTVRGELPRSVSAGSVVDVWTAREAESGGFGPPSVLVPSASVVRILESDGLIVDGSEVSVEVLVPRDSVAEVLEGIADSDAMSLVPVTVPLSD